MRFLVFEAYWKLIEFEAYLRRQSFSALYERVRSCPVRPEPPHSHSVEQICSCVDLAAIWYWKEVKCLQRSAATVYLLRRHGVAAELVIGAQAMPFKAHAWVEVQGRIVNDRPYLAEKYAVLDRC